MYKVSRFSIYLTLILALLIQLTVLNYLKIFGARPDLVSICVIFFGLFLGSGAGLECGIVAGFLEDIFALDFLGLNTFILAVTGFAVGVVRTKFFRESKITQAVLVFSFTIFAMTLHYLIVSVYSKTLILELSDYFKSSVVPTSIYTGLVSIPIFSKFIDIYNLKEEEEGLL